MIEIPFATTNKLKINGGNRACQPLGLTLVPRPLDIIEIQADEGETIARDKAHKAFQQLNEPVVITDDSWYIPSLRGFPGPYAKFVNGRFTVDDWLNLTRDLSDRRITLQKIIVYQDAEQQKVFIDDLTGTLLAESRGSYKEALMTLVTFDDGQSAAEAIAEHGTFRLKPESATSWRDFATWYVAKHD